MKPILWAKHAQQNLHDRAINEDDVELTIRQPEHTVLDLPGRAIVMRRYQDPILDKEMLLRVIIAESDTAITVITMYKTSQIQRYLRGMT